MPIPEGENSLEHFHLSEILAGHVQIAESEPIHADRQKETNKAEHHPNQHFKFRDLTYDTSTQLIIVHHTEYLELQCENAAVKAEEDESLEIPAAHAVVSVGAVVILYYHRYTILTTHLQAWQCDTRGGLYFWFSFSHCLRSVYSGWLCLS